MATSTENCNGRNPTRDAARANVAADVIRRRFMNRTDRLCFLSPWGKPCPIEGGENLDAILRAHLLGEQAPPVAVRWVTLEGCEQLKSW